MLRGRVSLRTTGITAPRPLLGACHVCPGDRDAANPEISPARAADRGRPRDFGPEARSAPRRAVQRRPVVILLHAGGVADDACRCGKSRQEPHRTSDHGDPRPSARGGRYGINTALYKTLTFGISALYTGVSGA